MKISGNDLITNVLLVVSTGDACPKKIDTNITRNLTTVKTVRLHWPNIWEEIQGWILRSAVLWEKTLVVRVGIFTRKEFKLFAKNHRSIKWVFVLLFLGSVRVVFKKIDMTWISMQYNKQKPAQFISWNTQKSGELVTTRK